MDDIDKKVKGKSFKILSNKKIKVKKGLLKNEAKNLYDSYIVNRNKTSIPIGAIAEPQEVARAVIFLCREKHVTGEIMALDGGFTTA